MKKALATALSLSLLSHMTLGALAESTIWEARQKGRMAYSQLKNTQLAALPSSILPQLPSVTKSLPTKVRPISPILAQQKIIPSESDLLENISQSHLQMNEVYRATGKKAPWVLLIQDIHLNSEAQMNAAKALDPLLTKGLVNTVGIEGAFESLDFSQLRSYPNKEITQKIARAFVDKKLMSGASYVGLTTEADAVSIIGVDSEPHYRANVAAYLEGKRQQENASKRLSQQKRALQEAKRRQYNVALKKWDDFHEAYMLGQIGVAAYVKKLVAMRPAKMKLSSSLNLFLEAYALESMLDLSRVETERRTVIEKLAPILSKEELSDLVAQSLAYRSGKVSFSDFYRSIQTLCKNKNVALEPFPAFRDYIRYVLLADRIQPKQLFIEMAVLEKDVVKNLISTKREEELVRRNRLIHLTRKLIHFELTPDEWEEYQSISDQPLKPFASFYRHADTRSKKIVENLLIQNDKNMALVVGGFHTAFITNLFKERNVSFVVATPKITKVDKLDGTAYLSVFSRDRTPLEQLFEGKKLSIIPESQHPSYLPFNRVVKAELAIAHHDRDDGALLLIDKENGLFATTSALTWIQGLFYRVMVKILPISEKSIVKERERFAIGAIMDWVRELFYPEMLRRNYNKQAWWIENTLLYVLIGIPLALIVGIVFYASAWSGLSAVQWWNAILWSFFSLGHFPPLIRFVIHPLISYSRPGLIVRGGRAPPRILWINFALSSFIAVTNVALGFVGLSFFPAFLISLLGPAVSTFALTLMSGYVIHRLLNISTGLRELGPPVHFRHPPSRKDSESATTKKFIEDYGLERLISGKDTPYEWMEADDVFADYEMEIHYLLKALPPMLNGLGWRLAKSDELDLENKEGLFQILKMKDAAWSGVVFKIKVMTKDKGARYVVVKLGVGSLPYHETYYNIDKDMKVVDYIYDGQWAPLIKPPPGYRMAEIYGTVMSQLNPHKPVLIIEEYIQYPKLVDELDKFKEKIEQVQGLIGDEINELLETHKNQPDLKGKLERFQSQLEEGPNLALSLLERLIKEADAFPELQEKFKTLRVYSQAVWNLTHMLLNGLLYPRKHGFQTWDPSVDNFRVSYDEERQEGQFGLIDYGAYVQITRRTGRYVPGIVLAMVEQKLGSLPNELVESLITNYENERARHFSHSEMEKEQKNEILAAFRERGVRPIIPEDRKTLTRDVKPDFINKALTIDSEIAYALDLLGADPTDSRERGFKKVVNSVDPDLRIEKVSSTFINTPNPIRAYLEFVHHSLIQFASFGFLLIFPLSAWELNIPVAIVTGMVFAFFFIVLVILIFNLAQSVMNGKSMRAGLFSDKNILFGSKIVNEQELKLLVFKEIMRKRYGGSRFADQFVFLRYNDIKDTAKNQKEVYLIPEYEDRMKVVAGLLSSWSQGDLDAHIKKWKKQNETPYSHDDLLFGALLTILDGDVQDKGNEFHQKKKYEQAYLIAQSMASGSSFEEAYRAVKLKDLRAEIEKRKKDFSDFSQRNKAAERGKETALNNFDLVLRLTERVLESYPEHFVKWNQNVVSNLLFVSGALRLNFVLHDRAGNWLRQVDRYLNDLRQPNLEVISKLSLRRKFQDMQQFGSLVISGQQGLFLGDLPIVVREKFPEEDSDAYTAGAAMLGRYVKRNEGNAPHMGPDRLMVVRDIGSDGITVDERRMNIRPGLSAIRFVGTVAHEAAHQEVLRSALLTSRMRKMRESTREDLALPHRWNDSTTVSQLLQELHAYARDSETLMDVIAAEYAESSVDLSIIYFLAGTLEMAELAFAILDLTDKESGLPSEAKDWIQELERIWQPLREKIPSFVVEHVTKQSDHLAGDLINESMHSSLAFSNQIRSILATENWQTSFAEKARVLGRIVGVKRVDAVEATDSLNVVTLGDIAENWLTTAVPLLSHLSSAANQGPYGEEGGRIMWLRAFFFVVLIRPVARLFNRPLPSYQEMVRDNHQAIQVYDRATFLIETGLAFGGFNSLIGFGWGYQAALLTVWLVFALAHVVDWILAQQGALERAPPNNARIWAPLVAIASVLIGLFFVEPSFLLFLSWLVPHYVVNATLAKPQSFNPTLSLYQSIMDPSRSLSERSWSLMELGRQMETRDPLPKEMITTLLPVLTADARAVFSGPLSVAKSDVTSIADWDAFFDVDPVNPERVVFRSDFEENVDFIRDEALRRQLDDLFIRESFVREALAQVFEDLMNKDDDGAVRQALLQEIRNPANTTSLLGFLTPLISVSLSKDEAVSDENQKSLITATLNRYEKEEDLEARYALLGDLASLVGDNVSPSTRQPILSFLKDSMDSLGSQLTESVDTLYGERTIENYNRVDHYMKLMERHLEIIAAQATNDDTDPALAYLMRLADDAALDVDIRARAASLLRPFVTHGNPRVIQWFLNRYETALSASQREQLLDHFLNRRPLHETRKLLQGSSGLSISEKTKDLFILRFQNESAFMRKLVLDKDVPIRQRLLAFQRYATKNLIRMNKGAQYDVYDEEEYKLLLSALTEAPKNQPSQLDRYIKSLVSTTEVNETFFGSHLGRDEEAQAAVLAVFISLQRDLPWLTAKGGEATLAGIGGTKVWRYSISVESNFSFGQNAFHGAPNVMAYFLQTMAHEIMHSVAMNQYDIVPDDLKSLTLEETFAHIAVDAFSIRHKLSMKHYISKQHNPDVIREIIESGDRVTEAHDGGWAQYWYIKSTLRKMKTRFNARRFLRLNSHVFSDRRLLRRSYKSILEEMMARYWKRSIRISPQEADESEATLQLLPRREIWRSAEKPAARMLWLRSFLFTIFFIPKTDRNIRIYNHFTFFIENALVFALAQGLMAYVGMEFRWAFIIAWGVFVALHFVDWVLYAFRLGDRAPPRNAYLWAPLVAVLSVGVGLFFSEISFLLFFVLLVPHFSVNYFLLFQDESRSVQGQVSNFYYLQYILSLMESFDLYGSSVALGYLRTLSEKLLQADSSGHLLEEVWVPLTKRAMAFPGGEDNPVSYLASEQLGEVAEELLRVDSSGRLLEKIWMPLYQEAIVSDTDSARHAAVSGLGPLATALVKADPSGSLLEKIAIPLYEEAFKSEDIDILQGVASSLGGLAKALLKVDPSGRRFEKVGLRLYREALSNKNVEVRESGAGVLGELAEALMRADSSARLLREFEIPRLFEDALGDEEDLVRYAAADGLTRLAKGIALSDSRDRLLEEIWNPLYRNALSDDSRSIQEDGAESLLGLVEGLVEVGSRTGLLEKIAIPLYEEAIKHEEGVVRRGAVRGLSYLIEGLLKENPNGNLPERVLENLYKKSLEDKDPFVRGASARILDRLAEVLLKDKEKRNRFQHIIFSSFENALRDTDEHVRSEAGRNLGILAEVSLITDPRGGLLRENILPLFEEAFNRHDDVITHRAVAESLGRLATSLWAVDPTGHLWEEAWVNLYEKALKSRDGIVRKYAVSSLGMLAAKLAEMDPSGGLIEKFWRPLYQKLRVRQYNIYDYLFIRAIVPMLSQLDARVLLDSSESLWRRLKEQISIWADHFLTMATQVAISQLRLGQREQAVDSSQVWSLVLDVLNEFRKRGVPTNTFSKELSGQLIDTLIQKGAAIDSDKLDSIYEDYFGRGSLGSKKLGPKKRIAYIVLDYELRRHKLPLEYGAFVRSSEVPYEELVPLLKQLGQSNPALINAIRRFSGQAATLEKENVNRYWGAVHRVLFVSARDWGAYEWLRMNDDVTRILNVDDEEQLDESKIKALQRISGQIEKVLSTHAAEIFHFDVEEPSWKGPTEKEINVLIYVAGDSDFRKKSDPLNQVLRAYYEARLKGRSVEVAVKAYERAFRRLRDISELVDPLRPFLDASGIRVRAPEKIDGQVRFIGRDVLLQRQIIGQWGDAIRELSQLVDVLDKGPLKTELEDYLKDNPETPSPEEMVRFSSTIVNWLRRAKKKLSDYDSLVSTIESHLTQALQLVDEQKRDKLKSSRRSEPESRNVIVGREENPINIIHLGWPNLGRSCLDCVQGTHKKNAGPNAIHPYVEIVYVWDENKQEKPLARITVGVDPINKALFLMGPVKASVPYEFQPVLGEYLKTWADDLGWVVAAPAKFGPSPGYDENLGSEFEQGQKSVQLISGFDTIYGDLFDGTVYDWEGVIEGPVYNGSSVGARILWLRTIILFIVLPIAQSIAWLFKKKISYQSAVRVYNHLTFIIESALVFALAYGFMTYFGFEFHIAFAIAWVVFEALHLVDWVLYYFGLGERAPPQNALIWAPLVATLSILIGLPFTELSLTLFILLLFPHAIVNQVAEENSFKDFILTLIANLIKNQDGEVEIILDAVPLNTLGLNPYVNENGKIVFGELLEKNPFVGQEQFHSLVASVIVEELKAGKLSVAQLPSILTRLAAYGIDVSSLEKYLSTELQNTESLVLVVRDKNEEQGLRSIINLTNAGQLVKLVFINDGVAKDYQSFVQEMRRPNPERGRVSPASAEGLISNNILDLGALQAEMQEVDRRDLNRALILLPDGMDVGGVADISSKVLQTLTILWVQEYILGRSPTKVLNGAGLANLGRLYREIAVKA